MTYIFLLTVANHIMETDLDNVLEDTFSVKSFLCNNNSFYPLYQTGWSSQMLFFPSMSPNHIKTYYHMTSLLFSG